MKTYQVNYDVVMYIPKEGVIHEYKKFHMDYLHVNDDSNGSESVISWEKELQRKHNRPVRVRSYRLLTPKNH